MGGKVKVSIEGGDELLHRLQQMGVDVDAVLETAAVEGALVIARDASGRAPEPVIKTQISSHGKHGVTVDIGPPDGKWYWRFIETGAGPHAIKGKKGPLAFEGDQGLIVVGGVQHPGMEAHPFLRPAMDTKKDAARDTVGEHLRKAVEK